MHEFDHEMVGLILSAWAVLEKMVVEDHELPRLAHGSCMVCISTRGDLVLDAECTCTKNPMSNGLSSNVIILFYTNGLFIDVK